MIITLKKDAPKAEVEKLIHTFENKGPVSYTHLTLPTNSLV